MYAKGILQVMAIASSRNNGEDKDGNVGNVDRDKKGRKYIYFGIVFTIIAILAITYLAMMTLSGTFLSFDGLDGITNHFPFYENAHNEPEFVGFSGRDIILLCCS